MTVRAKLPAGAAERRRRSAGPLVAALFVFAAASAGAEVLIPANDDQVLEVLPAAAGERARVRALQRALARDSRDVSSAVELAGRLLDDARSQGDARFAGRALAALRAWPDAPTSPDDVLFMRATVQQFIHEFDLAAANLDALVLRRPRHAQAWLTLATIRRVQGRYLDSDRACAAVSAAGAALYGSACRAENRSLRGSFDAARRDLNQLLSNPLLPGAVRGWLLTTLAENEVRAGNPHIAENTFRQALQSHADGYTRLAYADLLLSQRRWSEARGQLTDEPRTDAVLLRLAIAGTGADDGSAQQDLRELRARMSQSNLRPDAQIVHGRELAMFALLLDDAPCHALELALKGVQRQREPLDLLVLAESAWACGEPHGRQEAARLAQEVGLHDARLEAALAGR